MRGSHLCRPNAGSLPPAMVTVAVSELGPDRLIGCFQSLPTSFAGTEIADFFLHLAMERDRELRRTGNVQGRSASWPESAIENCTIRTEYRPVYRLQRKEFLRWGVRYPETWASGEHKRASAQRYSPVGTEGHYLGLTLAAAEDEVRFYEGGILDATKYLTLVVYASFDGLLDLTAGCIDAVWELIGLPASPSLLDMYLSIMDPRTDNEVANAIGLWARDRGFKGLVFPSARYGQGN